MPDKERLVKLLVEYGITYKYIDDLCDEIEECFAPELEKTRLWNILESIAKCSSAGISGCAICPINASCDPCEAEINCDYPCNFIKYTIDALEKEPT